MTAVASLGLSPVFGRWADFAPRPFENGLYVEIFGSHETDESRGGARTSRWQDTFFREQLTVFSNGYFYHPRFLRYRVSLSGALKQENYELTDTPGTGWKTGTGFEYDARFVFLPEHPYNIDLFALRHEPLYQQQSATPTNSVETSNGVQFRYRRKPFFVHAGYLHNTTTYASQSSDVKRVSADGQYDKSYRGGNRLSLNAIYNRSDFMGARGLEGTTNDYSAGGFFDAKIARLNASATKSASTETSPASGRSNNDRFYFNEILSLNLPARFNVDLAYRLTDNEGTTPGAGGAAALERTERSREVQFDLTHRLYRSLDSRYTFVRSGTTSTTGDSTLRSHALTLNYGKTIPRGRVTTGLSGSRSKSNNEGRIDVVGESHPGTAVPGSFALRLTNVEPREIDVFLPSPVSPFGIVHLVENDNFVVTPVGNTIQITIGSMPPEFAVPGTYDFSVTYSLVSGEFELLTKTVALNTSVSLLDNLLTPYVDVVTVRSDVVSGSFPATSLDSTTFTAGLNFLDGPWRALFEFQSLNWDVGPYRSWRVEGQYVGSIAPSTRAYATAAYLNRYYPSGTSSALPEPYTDENTSISGSIQQDLLARSLLLSAGASYTRLMGRVRGNSYSVNASLTWRLGKLDLIGGASVYGSDTQALTFDSLTRNHQYYYVRVRRTFSR